MIFELAQDFHDAVAAMPREHSKHRMLELFEEAIRRDIHFIARHPTTLFQCMWNTCWWYDCPEAAKHVTNVQELRRSGWIPPWQRNETKICEWMHAWRLTKKTVTPGFCWLRSLRPPKRNLGTGCSTVVTGHLGHIAGMSVGHHGRMLASIDQKGILHVWDTARFREIARIEAYQGLNFGRPFGVVIGPDMAWVATYGVDDRYNQWNYRSTIRLWDPVTLKRRAEAEGPHEITALTCIQNGQVLCGTCRGMLVCWDSENLGEITRLDIEDKAINSIAPSPDGRVWLAGSDGSVLWWDGKSTPQTFFQNEAAIQTIAASGDGRQIAWATETGHLLLWDVLRHQELMSMHCHSDRVTALVFVDSDRLASAGADGAVHCCSISEGRVVASLLLAKDPVQTLAVLDGEVIAGTFKREIHIWNPHPGPSEPLLAMHDPEGSVLLAEFSPGRRTLLTVGWCKSQQIWDARTGLLLDQGRYDGSLWSASVPQYAVSSSFQAAWDAYETTIETKHSETPIAWWPESLTVARRPSDTIWGGSASNHIVLLHLEGRHWPLRSLFASVFKCLGNWLFGISR